MFQKLFDLFKKNKSVEERVDYLNWHSVTAPDPSINWLKHWAIKTEPNPDYFDVDCVEFLYDNFNPEDFSVVRVNVGFFSAVKEVKFKNEEDALAFKLRYL